MIIRWHNQVRDSLARIRPRAWVRWGAVFLLLLLWARLLSAANQQSVTFDEIIHVLQGVLFWQRWSLWSVVQNPPLINALMGLPVQFLFHPTVPFADPVWQTNDWLAISKVFAWETNDNGLQLIWAARWAIMLLTLMMAAVAARFAGQLGAFLLRARPFPTLLTLFLLTFDPNILAHGFLATTDLGMAFFLLTAVYLVWRYWATEENKRPWWMFWLTAVAVGLAFSAKFTAVILIPALYLLVLFRAVVLRQSLRQIGRAALVVTAWITIGAIIFLAFYRFQWAALTADYQQQQAHQLSGHSAFLHGQVKVGGWWYYFPVTFLIKTPLPTLVLLAAALVTAVRQRPWRSWSLFWLLLPATAVFGAGLVSQVNIGYRYLLPALPLLFVFTGQLAGGWGRQAQPRQAAQNKVWAAAGWLLVGGLAVASLAAHPHYLAFFNRLVGGPANGWQWLVDSNVDWGQDIGALAAYEQAHLPEPYQVAWLGTAPLSAYGIRRGEAAPIWPQGREDPLTDPFYPPAPAPGQYVISATQLHGVYLKNPARFAWFKTQNPLDRIGYSLFVFDVPVTGPAAGIGLAGIGPAMIAPADFAAAFQSNDVSPRRFDARTSFLWPGGGETAVWTAVGDGHQPTHPLLQAFYPPAPAISGQNEVQGQVWRYGLYDWPVSPVTAVLAQPNASTDLGWSPEAVVGAADWATQRREVGGTAVFSDTLELLGYQLAPAPESVDLLSLWRVAEPPAADLKIFVHLLNAAGQVVAQHDGLDVARTGLRSGDEFAQLHTIPLPPDLPPGDYALQIGLYRVDDGARLSVPVDGMMADRILLQTIHRDS